MYSISDLNEMNDADLKSVAESMNLKKIDPPTKKVLFTAYSTSRQSTEPHRRPKKRNAVAAKQAVKARPQNRAGVRRLPHSSLPPKNRSNSSKPNNSRPSSSP